MNAKKAAGEKVVEFVKDGMILGLGTGSTIYWTILKLGELVRNGLSIRGVATSLSTEELAIKMGIPLVNLEEVDEIDLTIDGADEVNSNLELIKGGGGALLREKIVATNSRKNIIIADYTKYVSDLGDFPLPIEVVPFGWKLTCRQICKLGCRFSLRMDNHLPFISDNGNYILDCQFGKIQNPKELAVCINMIPGVVDNGLFVGMTDIVLIGSNDGGIETLNKNSFNL
ncbi:ribose-5-phosphate isomerase RpiA [Bacillus sp. FSL K6-3431]|uniref:ribose-5-phosphate isomerase RpiA n=1 Tax=Bacillus sp. FSL K6-3431 TaxID=2921500 RepID=UPI0030FA0898